MNSKKHWEKHPAFPQPDSKEVKLWRYMDFPKFESLLKTSRLVFPRADKLGEPFEGTRPKGDIEWWKRKADKTEKNQKTIEHNSKWLSDAASFLRDKYYVSCWHMNEFENQLMWKSYTKSIDSVAIQTTYSLLSGCTHPSVPLGLVRYIDYTEECLPIPINMLDYITHKDIFFKAETEIRAVGFSLLVSPEWEAHFKTNHFELESKPGFYCYAPEIDIQKLIKAVVLNPLISEDMQKIISELCHTFGIIPPKQSRMGKTNRPTF